MSTENSLLYYKLSPALEDKSDKELTIKEKTGAKRLSEIDNRFRAKTERLVCEELSIVLQKSPEQIKEQLTSLLT